MKYSILLSLGLALSLPLHAEETPAVPVAPTAPATPEAPAKEKHDPAEMFKKRDKDGDGFVSKEEFTKSAKDAAKAEAAFAKKDANSDGKLSPEEFAAGGKGGKKKNK